MKRDADGWHLHQSDINGHCLEQLRLDTVAEGPRQETDAATVGTALHAGIEDELNNGFWDDENAFCGFTAQQFLELLEGYQADGANYVRSTMETDLLALKQLDQIARAWYRSSERQMLMQHDPKDRIVEWEFDLHFMDVVCRRTSRTKPEVIPIYLAGTADLVLLDKQRIWDWKSANSSYKRWEKQRWAPQQVVYTWAANEAGIITPNADGVIPFEYKVFLKQAKPAGCETVSVSAGPGNWDFLAHKLTYLVNMMYMVGFEDPWPLDDMHVLCSPKWCGHWDRCKGLHVSPETDWT